MTDLEITKRCAEKMGYGKFQWQTGGIVTGSDLPICLPDGRITYDPLHDDAQAMALVKKFELYIHNREVFTPTTATHEGRRLMLWGVICPRPKRVAAESYDDLNRAICECVAQLP